MLFLIFTLSIFLSFITDAYAYLDPGSGSIILQAIITVIATVGSALVLWWKKLKANFKNFFKKKPQR